MWSERMLVALVAGAMLWPRCAAQEVCYTTGGVAGIIIATIVVTIIVGGLTAAIARYLWKKRSGALKGGEKVTPAETGFPEKHLIGQKDDYAFDNPYFKDDDGDHGDTPDAAEKGEAGFPTERGDNDISQSLKGSKQKKHRPFTSLPFHSVFNHGGKNKKSMDDSFLSKQSKRISVPLRGHDFTGLGFNICGNMRDGIFVKDVLHRGPASESGKIKAGDRIISVTVSFGSMVYEDALTILSYASPYDVRLELEEGGAEKNGLMATSSPGKRLSSASFRNGGQRLFHPLYRSQSIDDLTQIGKETFTLRTKLSDSAVSYKRSLSSQLKTSIARPQLKTSESVPDTKVLDDSKGSRKSSTSSNASASKRPANDISESHHKIKDNFEKSFFPLLKSAVLSKKEAPKIEPGKASSESNGKLIHSNPEFSSELATKNTESSALSEPSRPITENLKNLEMDSTLLENSQTVLKTPTAPPRKTSTPSKRRAPAPPKVEQVLNTSTTETSAVVHQVDDNLKSKSTFPPEISTTDNTRNVASPNHPDAKDHSACAEDKVDGKDIVVPGTDKSYELEEDSTSVSDNSLEQNSETEESTNRKRKASSLGDLTKLDEETNRKTSSSILERAVSLDLQQQYLPEGNLCRQQKTLQPPTFNPDDTSEEDFESVRQVEDTLRHWDLKDSWDKLPIVPDTSDTSPSASIIVSDFQKQILSQEKKIDVSISNGHHTLMQDLSDPIVISDSKQCVSGQDKENNIACEKESTFLSNELSPEKKAQINITSTPAQNAEYVSFPEESSPINTVVSLAAGREIGPERSPTISCDESLNFGSDTMFTPSLSGNLASSNSPVTINIPIIPPVIRHYEKLSFSPGLYTLKDSSDGYRSGSSEVLPPLCKPTLLQEQRKTTSAVYVPSSHDTKSVASSKEGTTQVVGNDEFVTTAVDPVNGKEIDASALEYRTALEYPTVSGNKVFTTSKLITSTSPSNSSIDTTVDNSLGKSEITIHTSDINFTKNVIISNPDEETSRLNTRPKSPPVQVETSQESTVAFF